MKQEEADEWAKQIRTRYPAGVQVTVCQIGSPEHPRYAIDVSVPRTRRMLREGQVKNMPSILAVCGVLLEKSVETSTIVQKGKTCKKTGQRKVR